MGPEKRKYLVFFDDFQTMANIFEKKQAMDNPIREGRRELPSSNTDEIEVVGLLGEHQI